MAAGIFVYYCHGYGHATRVSAFACHLLSLPEETKPTIYIVSSAPKHDFAKSIGAGVQYCYAEIDPVIVQPLAYHVDRQKSVQVLKQFLCKKEALLEEQGHWLTRVNARCVLSDAVSWMVRFASAAKRAGVPFILITSFPFDSVYSYLARLFIDQSPTLQPHKPLTDTLIPDIPVPKCELMPLVEPIHSGYRCADLLLEPPGNMPIPSFSSGPSLPASSWINTQDNRFHPSIIKTLFRPYNPLDIYTSIPFPPSFYTACRKTSHLLSSVVIPSELHDPEITKVLYVSFGGQVFRTPGGRSPSRLHSRKPSANDLTKSIQGLGISSVNLPPSYPGARNSNEFEPVASPRSATSLHVWIPGAPPASKISGSPLLSLSPSIEFPTFNTIPSTPVVHAPHGEFAELAAEDETESRLLPDSSWVAIVCGVTKDQWESQDDSELPEGFYVAPQDVYMPDLTVAADVLLGKLGYGTVSECVDSATPFVYVSRSLFIEEHGLRLILNSEGVGVELSRGSYEAGEWPHAVQDAFIKGQTAKIKKRKEMVTRTDVNLRAAPGRKMAASVVAWVDGCWNM
ncbi:uncharacterized protein BT62DRAFT_978168 [Guyanagaster necrorhizus]|uniref:Uncharacterized protein n=1 Tax=Guyanagaster necrorhizus TaxID=856835 RepID=A0A9P8AXL4_9AGAR|nr:uncharacterized protein BT62DRAFT_978168 [Guyanagaster necrorhizus MCA 3950]KAG7451356.1 hypothetical protein BT62DRAFT_978168 [Guyanagaster necrorhizus MCA 3950]